VALLSAEGAVFVRDRHLATLSTLLADGSPHVVPVGFTFDGSTVRIITGGPTQKVRNVRRDGRASVSQLDGARWLTLSGTARILDDPAAVADAVARYAVRYRPPRENPLRVVIAIEVTRAMGSAGMLLPPEHRATGTA
jgi:PPOX class probable F420-dependent enzyme